MNRILVLLFAMICLLQMQPAQAQFVDPKTSWQQIETAHFKIVFDSKHRLIAELYADYAEQSYSLLINTFNGEAPRKTVIVLNSTTDLANGAASNVPYPMIMAFNVLPMVTDPISDYGVWGRELFTHEYTHILNMEPAHGWFLTPLKYVFGSLIRPNMFLPRWYLEGLAVEDETRFSRFGRLRSPNFMAEARAMSLEGLLEKEDISRINEIGIPYYPGGSRPYLMGSLLWSQMIQLKNPGLVGRLNDRYSRRVPFFINEPIIDELGKDYQELLDLTYENVNLRAKAQQITVQAHSSYKSVRANDSLGFDSHSPTISPDGTRLIYVSHGVDSDSMVEMRERSNLKASFLKSPPKKIVDGSTIQKVSWLDSNEFIYDHVDTYNRYYQYSDLYKYNINEKKKTQLTHGLRAREPAVSPDGVRIAIVQMDASATRLGMVDITGETFEPLYEPALEVRVSRPDFLDESHIVFSERAVGGRETLKVIDIRTHKIEEILSGYAPAHFPKKTANGLIFESERNGIPNIYLASTNLQKARPITNDTTAATSADFDPSTHELIFTELGGTGQKITSAPATEWNQVPGPLPQVEPLVDDHWPKSEVPKIHAEKKVEEYSPWSYLLPRYWIPYLYFIPGGTYVSGSTSSADPLEHHSYSLLASYDSLTANPSFFGTYTNATIPVPFTITAANYYEYLYSFGLVRQSTIVNPIFSSYVYGLDKYWHAGLGWSYFQTQYTGATFVRNGPMVFASYSNIKQRGEQISPERGVRALVSQTTYIPSLGSTNYEDIEFHGNYYLSGFLPKHHVIAMSLNVAYEPRLNYALLGAVTSSGYFQPDVLNSTFVLRGYPYGALIGRSLYSGNLEYRLPISYRFAGFGTKPLFIEKIYGDVFLDGASVDGFYYGNDLAYHAVGSGHVFLGSGGEFKIDTNMFYQLPITFTLGLYYGFDPNANFGILPFIGFIL